MLRWDREGSFPTAAGPRGLAFDGTNIRVVNTSVSTVSKMNPVTGRVTGFTANTMTKLMP